jgi:hypothetical protein
MTISLLAGGTTSTSGGSAQDFSRTNTSVNNGNEYADVSEPDFFARQKVVLSTRQPALQSDGSWSKQKTSSRFVTPKILASGEVVYNITRVEVEVHPETSAAELAIQREMGGQMAIGAALDELYTAGTLPA